MGINSLNPNDEILVKPGEIIPADGLVLQGVSSVNEAVFTGEHLPVDKQPHDTVLAGTINHDQALIIQVQSVRSEAKLNHIENLLQQALAQKPQLTQLVDHLSSLFVAIVLLITVLAGWYWYLADAANVLPICLAVLVASCPCALSLATPSALAAAANHLQRIGFLISQPHVLETLAQTSTVIFDKTGTLTKGKLSLGQIDATGPMTESEGLAIARALEIYSEHPIALAFTQIESDANTLETAYEVITRRGQGLIGKIRGEFYRIGTAEFCQEFCQESTAHYVPPPTEHGLWIGLCNQQQILMWFELIDEIKVNARRCVQAFQAAGLKVVMLSGDSSAYVAEVANQLGIEKWQAGASAEDKLKYIHKLQDAGEVVLMAGDGVNDAPVLAAANISVAVAEACQLAKSKADSLLLTENILRLFEAYQHALFTQRIIKQNLFWALLYNLTVLPIAAAGFLPPYLAALGMSCSSILVISNAQRLTRCKKSPADARQSIQTGVRYS